MSGMSVSVGLASGTDYKSLVNQLMQIEAQPQTLLKNRLATAQSQASALRQVNTNMAALAGAAKAVTAAAAWTAAKATSSSSAVTASAATGAAPGSLTFAVDRLATAQSMVSGQNWTTSNDAFGLSSPFTVTKGGVATDIPLTDGNSDGTVSLAEAVSAINKADAGVTATAVNTGAGYRLQLTATATGVANGFSLSPATMTGGGFTALAAAQDAQITVGSGSAGAYSVTSGTNTFSGVLDGTTFTVGSTTSSATVTVGSDTSAAVTAVQALVTAANNVLSTIDNLTDATANPNAPLKGNWSLTKLAGDVLTSVSSAVGTAGSAGSLGLQLTSAGTLKFDAGVFQSKLEANPALLKTVFGGELAAGTDLIAGTGDDTLVTDGVAARLQRLALRASDSVSGSITSLAQGQDTRVDDLQDQIDAWDLRLASRRATLNAQYTALETALGTLQSQSTWLSSQINSLPSWSSDS
ncbi:flagellar filament capping protein FliD [Modestobacter marinus]|uniref:flagellar filament capping protein FliD n=1 Tax=Modestobacter marinus TaxID=477641 RepID=UPI001C97461C|nr:flagellar filament capping protein FliD [Modestobacter marinus]